jgi:lipopolysaccharide transport system permease protein
VHINFSREALVIAAFGDSVFNFLIRLVLIAAVFAWYRIIPMWTTLLVPVILIPLALMTVGLGFILALANGIFRDVANSLTLLLTLAMFLSPVIYKPSTTKGLLSYLNPVSPFIIATRDLVTSGTLSKPYWLLWASAAGVAVFFVGWRIFHLAMTRIAERV